MSSNGVNSSCSGGCSSMAEPLGSSVGEAAFHRRILPKTKSKPRTRKLTRLFRPYFGRNTPRVSVGVTFLVRQAWSDSIGKSLLMRKYWSDTFRKTSLIRSCSDTLAWQNTLGKTLLARDSWSHTLCNTLLERSSL